MIHLEETKEVADITFTNEVMLKDPDIIKIIEEKPQANESASEKDII